MLNTAELDCLLYTNESTRAQFRGTWSLDAFLRQFASHPRGFFVFNSKPSTHPGEHWLAVVCDGRMAYFFDSYGFLPIFYNKSLHDLLTSLPSGVQSNITQLQGLTSSVCGDYCFHFLRLVGKGFSFKHCIDLLFSLDSLALKRDMTIASITKSYVSNHLLHSQKFKKCLQKCTSSKYYNISL